MSFNGQWARHIIYYNVNLSKFNLVIRSATEIYYFFWFLTHITYAWMHFRSLGVRLSNRCVMVFLWLSEPLDSVDIQCHIFSITSIQSSIATYFRDNWLEWRPQVCVKPSNELAYISLRGKDSKREWGEQKAHPIYNIVNNYCLRMVATNNQYFFNLKDFNGYF